MEDSSTTPDYFYDEDVMTSDATAVNKMRTGFAFMYVAVYSITILLGVLFNLLNINMARKYESTLKVKRFLLGLAVTHLLLCLFIPLYIISAWEDFNWRFELEVCKLGSYVRAVNMFSVSMMITFWNIKNCREFPRFTVLLSWIIGAILSVPSLLYREVQTTAGRSCCLDKYVDTDGRMFMMMAIMCSRFIFGLVLPFVVTCYNSLRKNKDDSLVIRPVAVGYFLCWTPLLFLSLLQVHAGEYNGVITHIMSPATALSVSYSCISPIIIFWLGKKEQWWESTVVV
ncbi:hypothetical protein DPEC_G00257860 [Dallia pectoralis]|uniref:Uncharacterized protein n=1 Tax=Dallia pectoralis TaxID=75939 RepID=A0ACC2FQP5_DALPE|nr:hypothetical protein DPEC_G00257860 [Dallia pectoralis]